MTQLAFPLAPVACPQHTNTCRQCDNPLTPHLRTGSICIGCGWWTHADICLCDTPQCAHVLPLPEGWPLEQVRCPGEPLTGDRCPNHQETP